jgi:ferredoxin
MEYRRASVYFASGTGNSFRAAGWLRDACQARGAAAELIPVSAANPAAEIRSAPDQLVGLAFPTHGFLPPWSVIAFLLRMPRKSGAHFLCLPTRGSFFIGRVLIPGAAGLANFLPGLILLFKGFRPRGAVSLDLPVNITSVHPPLTDRHARRVEAAARAVLDRHLQHYFRRGWLWLTWNNFYELVWVALVMGFWPWFPLLYLLIGRLFMGRTLFATYRCTGCGTCARACPSGALVMRGRPERLRPYWRHSCEYCLRCLNFCPHHAVTSGYAWAALLWCAAAGVAQGAWLFGVLVTRWPGAAAWKSYSVIELLNVLFYYPVLIVTYFLLDQLIRLRPVRKFFTYAGLAWLFGQYRAPDTTLADLTGRNPEPSIPSFASPESPGTA